MKKKVLVTGSKGLIGRHLIKLLKEKDFDIVEIDVRGLGADCGDIRDYPLVESRISGCTGVVHLAGVSRVKWAEEDPNLCWETNVNATSKLLEISQKQDIAPWIVVASSREVYGESRELPVSEEATLSPINIYGRSKLEIERMVTQRQKAGLNAAIIRFSNVYGCVEDYEDRVIPAFCRAAVLGRQLRVDGLENTFDFTHISDVVRGIYLVIKKLETTDDNLQPIHFATGVPTSLRQAAEFAIDAANSNAEILVHQSRNYDVSKFYGDTVNAKNILGWEARIPTKMGVEFLVKDFRNLVNA